MPGAIQAPANRLRSAFVGEQGLRSGWRFLIYMAAFFALMFAISPLLSFVAPHQPLLRFLVGETLLAVAAIVPAVALSRFERRPFEAYGLTRRGAFGVHFWMGALWGFAAISLLLLAMRGLGVFSLDGLALHGIRILKYGAYWATLFLLVGLFEEFISRGYSQFTLAQGMGFWPAAILLSAGFGAVHLTNPGEAWVGALGAGSIGLFFCLTLRRTGTLWFAIGMHAAWDWGETFLYSVPDSGILPRGHLLNTAFHGPRWLTGGTVGPEGSALMFLLIAVLWVVFDRLYPARQDSATVGTPGSEVIS